MTGETKQLTSQRVPTTKRAQLTVDAILQSFGSLCAEYSYDEVTTNLVAERAGVSVGSIYQYFPNKHAIAVALYEETSSRVSLRIREAILEDITESLAQTIHKTLTVLLQCYQEHRGVLIDLPDASASLREAVHHLTVVDLIERSSRIYLEQHLDELGNKRPELLRYFMGTIVKGCMRDYLNKPPPQLTDEVFVEELSRAILLYAQDGLRG